LLVSRLETEVVLQPRHVVLPTRLVIRYSCGSRLQDNDGLALSLPVLRDVKSQTILVKPLSPDEILKLPPIPMTGAAALLRSEVRSADIDKPDVARLLKALRHQEADRVPHLELFLSSKSVCEYVLERELKGNGSDAFAGRHVGSPEDHVEFAQRLGMDAVVCRVASRADNFVAIGGDGDPSAGRGLAKIWADLDHLEPFVPLADQISSLERYLRAAQGTGVGVIAGFASFFVPVVAAVGPANLRSLLANEPRQLQKLLDTVLVRHEKMVRAICDRFADDLALVLIEDNVADRHEVWLPPDAYRKFLAPGMKRLMAPALEHGVPIVFHSPGKMDALLPILCELGFAAVHPLEPECNNIFAAKEQWGDRLALMGNISGALLAHGSREEIDLMVRESCRRLAPGGGYVLSSATGVIEGLSPENFVAMTRAVHKYGRYDTMDGT
jgi:hypothetical protein